jgi:hypothetical protein
MAQVERCIEKNACEVPGARNERAAAAVSNLLSRGWRSTSGCAASNWRDHGDYVG